MPPSLARPPVLPQAEGKAEPEYSATTMPMQGLHGNIQIEHERANPDVSLKMLTLPFWQNGRFTIDSTHSAVLIDLP